jgi:hypothetical protein
MKPLSNGLQKYNYFYLFNNFINNFLNKICPQPAITGLYIISITFTLSGFFPPSPEILGIFSSVTGII